MPSFDIVSKVDPQILDNAVNTARREIETRYDLRGTNSGIELDKKALTIRLSTEDAMKLDALLNILLERSAKQGIDVKAFDLGEQPQPSGKTLQRTIQVQKGIERETAKKIIKAIREAGFKVQAQIKDDMIRVTGKKIDDLQQVMALCLNTDFRIPIQYENLKNT